MEEERKKQAEKERLRALDDAPQRAIQDFMGGNLEVKKDIKSQMSKVKREEIMESRSAKWL